MRMPCGCLLLACVIAVPAVAAQPAPAPPALKARLDAEAPRWLKQYDVPSVAVAYIDHGALAWTAAYGEQSPGVPATPRTLYNVASMTKPISAEVFTQLAARGEVTLDEPMSAYWVDPDIATSPWRDRLTARLALTHQTGFPNWRYETNDVLTFKWEPGTRVGYSGEGYDYLAHFLEKKTGRPFEALAQALVFDRLGMKDTAYSNRPWFAGRLAASKGPGGEVRAAAGAARWNAADNLRTTAGDYARFMIAVMGDDGLSPAAAAERLEISREQADQLCAPGGLPPPDCPAHLGYALGWAVFQYDQRRVVMHGGADWGVNTIGFFSPETRSGVVIFTNGDNGRKVIAEIGGLLGDTPAFTAFLRLQAAH